MLFWPLSWVGMPKARNKPDRRIWKPTKLEVEKHNRWLQMYFGFGFQQRGQSKLDFKLPKLLWHCGPLRPRGEKAPGKELENETYEFGKVQISSSWGYPSLAYPKMLSSNQ